MRAPRGWLRARRVLTTPRRRLKRRGRQGHAALPRCPGLLIVPSLLLALLIISYPVFNIVYQSLHEVSRFGTVRGFSGLDNFRAVFADPVFIGSLWRTEYWTACVVGGTVLISVPGGAGAEPGFPWARPGGAPS